MLARTLSAELVAKGIWAPTISFGPVTTPIYGRVWRVLVEGTWLSVGRGLVMK
ncbi:MAG: hypothetical protein M3R15_06950 [Acidobacteriota bacterium]|nr:hypothetical protein [Acidobacteriota bacterium]